MLVAEYDYELDIQVQREEAEANGEARGEARNKKENAMEMLHDGLPYEKIAKYIKAPVETIKAWKAK